MKLRGDIPVDPARAARHTHIQRGTDKETRRKDKHNAQRGADKETRREDKHNAQRGADKEIRREDKHNTERGGGKPGVGFDGRGR